MFFIFILIFISSCSDKHLIKKEKKNIVFILVDDLNMLLGCYGASAYTPYIDSLASMGYLFSNAYCQYPACNPSRVSILTSTYPSSNKVLTNYDNLRELNADIKTLPEYLAEKGYSTMGIGKIFHGTSRTTDEFHDKKSWNKEYLSSQFCLTDVGKQLSDHHYFSDNIQSPLLEDVAEDDEDYYDGLYAKSATSLIRKHSRKKESFFWHV